MEGKNMECDTESPSFFSTLHDLFITNSSVPAKRNLVWNEKVLVSLTWTWTEVGKFVQAEVECLDL